ncbi:ATP-binding cassette domain-containing protein [Pseudomonas baetica]|uniref:ATP-binding cassette domain-containing protein n=1 Tax=Pseudomonas baetica TaxID=674054 RepID=UPI001C8C8C67|nr:ATP-binding cassette domain-containing protein [Pseudomonas baetica]MBX9409560.1 ATP-binding cassette domain-containing protein [Pseudomonas baetica]
MRTLIRTACKKHRLLLITTITTIISLKLLALAPPLLLGAIVDSLSNADHTTLNTLLIFTAAFTLAGCAQSIIAPLQTLLLSKLVQRIVMNASITWLAQLMGKEFSRFSTWRIGHFIKSVERGITAHEQLLTFFVTVGFPLCLEFLIVAAAFWYMGGTWIFLAMASLGVLYLFATHRIIRWRRKHIDAVNEQEDELSAILFNTLKAGKSIKLERAEHTALQPLNKAFNQYAETAVTVAGSGGLLSGAKVLFISLSTGGLLSWGVVDQLSGSASISVGQLVAIFSIAGTFLLNISALTEGYRVLDQFLADQRRLQQLLKSADFDHEGRESELTEHEESTLRLEPCVITDNGAVRLSLANPIDFKQGQSVAITGHSGAGKSTLLEALAGLNTSVRSQLNIDDIPVDRLNAQSHLQILRYCPQSPQFLEGSFDRSVLFGVNPALHLRRAIQCLQLEEIVSQRDISENAANISGGEAKRLSLLRLINRPGKFNLFDEPSASIEPRLASPVWDLLFETFAGQGLICVTHDVSHLHRFDRVIVMHNGEIIEDGPWHDLVDRAAIKRLLSDLQTVKR